MKEIMAFIRAKKVNATKEALTAAGFPAFTCRAVLGRGKGLTGAHVSETARTLLDSADGLPHDDTTEAMTELVRLLPKRLFMLVVADEQLGQAIATIMRVNSTGHAGDGKVYVLDVDEAWCVRTGADAL